MYEDRMIMLSSYQAVVDAAREIENILVNARDEIDSFTAQPLTMSLDALDSEGWNKCENK